MRSRQIAWAFVLVISVSGAFPREAASADAPKYRVAFSSFGPVNLVVYVADADGSNARPLLQLPDQHYNASFTADGRWILFTSTRGGSAHIYRVRADGSGLERLTDSPAFNDQAAASPDGRLVAFVSDRSGQADIWL